MVSESERARVKSALSQAARQRAKSVSVVSDQQRGGSPVFPQSDQANRPQAISMAQVIDLGAEFAVKSGVGFNRYMMDFINNTGAGHNPNRYSDNQLLGAYMSSVYLYAALRRVRNLISQVRVVAEIKQGNRYVRAPETAPINQIFEKDGAKVFGDMYMNWAIYGSAVCYKTKTYAAAIAMANDRPIYGYKDKAIAGLHVLDKPMWELDEDHYSGLIRGIHVAYGDPVAGNRNYLDRNEFVYWTDWNPQNRNRGQSITTVAIHEAVTNASIARWAAEYFTRGAMPLILVALEDDPALVTETDLMKYKRQLEAKMGGGVNTAAQSLFVDRKVTVEQVGIPPSDIGAPELNENALEGIAAAVGLDRELIVTPQGGSQERHAVLVKRAWVDTIIPVAQDLLKAFQDEMGLPEGMKLVLDLSHISELEAERENVVGVETGVYGSGLQTYNETRQRMDMQSIPELDGMVNVDGSPTSVYRVAERARMPHADVRDTYQSLLDNGLLNFNEMRAKIGLPPVKSYDQVIMVDGSPVSYYEFVKKLQFPMQGVIDSSIQYLQDGISTFNDVRRMLNLNPIPGMDRVMILDGAPVSLDVFLNELDTPTRDYADQYATWYDGGLIRFNEYREAMGLNPLSGMNDVVMVDGRPVRAASLAQLLSTPPRDYIDTHMEYLDRGVSTFNQLREALGLPLIEGMDDVLVVDGRPVKLESFKRELALPTERESDLYERMYDQGLVLMNRYREMTGLEPLADMDDVIMLDGQPVRVGEFLRQLGLPTRDVLDTQMEYLDRGVASMNDVRLGLGLEVKDGLDDVFFIDGRPIRLSRFLTQLDSPSQDQVDVEMDLFDAGIQSVNELRSTIGLNPIPELDGYYMVDRQFVTLDRIARQNKFLDDKLLDAIGSLWNDDVLKLSEYRSLIDMPLPEGEPDGYRSEIEAMRELRAERDVKIMELEFSTKGIVAEALAEKEAEIQVSEKYPPEDGGGDDGGDGGGWRSVKDDNDDPDGEGGGEMTPNFRPDGLIQGIGATLMDRPYFSKEEEHAVDFLKPNNVVQFVGRNSKGSWVQVLLANGASGWLREDSVDQRGFDIMGLDITWQDESEFVENAEDLPHPFDDETAVQTTNYADDLIHFDTSQYQRDEGIFDTYSESDNPSGYYADRVDITDQDIRDEISRTPDILTWAKPVTYPVRKYAINDVASEGKECYISMWIPNDPTLLQIQNHIKSSMGEQAMDIQWQDPSTFHVTMVYAQNMDVEKFQQVRKHMPAYLAPMPLRIEGVGSFDNQYETVIVLRVILEPKLEEMQRKAVNLMRPYSPNLSRYSDPEAWRPHITLGYAPPGTSIDVDDFFVEVMPVGISFTIDNYREIGRIPFIHWRERLGNHDEPDGADAWEYMTDSQKVEYVRDWTQMQRRRMETHIKRWQRFGKPDKDIPPRLKQAVLSVPPSAKSTPYDLVSASIMRGEFDNGKSPDMIDAGRSLQSDALDELRAWEKKARKNPLKAVSFEAIHIPMGLQSSLRADLQRFIDGNGSVDLRHIFDEVRNALNVTYT